MGALDILPSSFKEELLAFLKEKQQNAILKAQLLKTSIVIEDGNYQITIDTIEDLELLIKALEKASYVPA